MKKILTFLLVFSSLFGLSQRGELLIVPPVGHTAQITDIDVSKDGRFILTASVDKKLILWDYITGYEVKSFTGTEYAATSCAISDDNKMAVSCGFDNYIRLWDIKTGKLTKSWDAGEYGANKVRFISGSEYVISVGNTGKLSKWNTNTGKIVFSSDLHEGIINTLAVDMNGEIAVSAGKDGNIVIYDLNKAEVKKNIQAHSADITAVAISSANKYIASVSYDMSAKIWDKQTGELIREYNLPGQMLMDVDFSPDQSRFAVISITGIIHEWNIETGEKLFEKPINAPMGKVLRYTQDGRVIISCGYDANMKFTNSVSGRFLREFKAHTSPIDAMAVNSSGDGIITAHRDTYLRSFDFNTASHVKSIFTNKWLYSNIIFLNDQESVIASHSYKSPDIFDLNTEEVFDLETNHSMGLTSIHICYDESLIFTSSFDSTALVTNINTNEVLISHRHNNTATSTAVSPDEKYFFSACLDGFIQVSDVQNGKSVQGAGTDGVQISSLATSPDNRHLAAGLWTGEIIIFEYPGMKEVQRLKPHRWIVSDISFSQNGKNVLSVSWDTDVKLTDWMNNQQIAEYKGHTNSLSKCLYTPDYKYVLSSGWDNVVKVLNADDLTEIVTVIFIGESDFLVVRPDMYYFGTPDAAKRVSFTKDLQTFGFEQFDLLYNRPDKVLEVLPYADTTLIPLYRRAYERRLQKTGFNPTQLRDEINVPSVKITNLNKIDFNSLSEFVKIEFEISDGLFNIDRYNIWVNGVPEFGRKGQSDRKKTNFVKNSKNIRLNPGRNVVEVAAINVAGVESFKQAFEIVYIPHVEKLANAYIISVAVAEYDNPQYNLQYTLNDGRELINTFKDIDGYNFVYTDSLFGKDCNRQNFEKIRKLLEKSDVNDLVILHFAGHGLLDEELNFWFATHDTDFDNPGGKGIEYAQIEALIDDIPARKKLVLIDACHSGEVDIEDSTPKGFDSTDDMLTARGVAVFSMPREDSRSIAGLKNSFELMKEVFTDVRKGTGAVIVSAATGSGYAIEFRHLQHGIFTYAVLKGIRNMEADLNKDGSITVSELRQYVLREVGRISNGQQQATSRTDNLIYDFKVF